MVIQSYGRSQYVTGHFYLIYKLFFKLGVRVDIDDDLIEVSLMTSPTDPNNGLEPNPGQIAMLANMGFMSARHGKPFTKLYVNFLGL